MREVCKGKGYVTVKIPYADLASKYPSLKIDDQEEFEAVVQSILDGLQEEDWLDLFEHGIINKFGFAITYEFAHNLGLNAGRKMVVIERPVQSGSTKTLIDDSPRSKLYVFGDALVDDMFGPDFRLSKISILLNEPDNEDQVRHIDYKGHIVRDNNYEDTDFAIVIPYKFRGNLIVYDYSQHIVHACEEVENAGVDVHAGYSIVSEKLQANENFKIGIYDCEKKEAFFGTDEMFIFGGNFVHGGAKNTMYIRVFKVHLYVTKKGRNAPDNKTIVLHNIVWDLTRKGATTREFVFKDLETEEEYSAYKEEKDKQKKAGASKAGAKTNTDAMETSSDASDDEASQASTAKTRKVGRSPKIQNIPPAEGAKKRGRPKKVA